MIELFTSPFSLFGAFLGIDLVELIKWAGVLGVAIIVFAESGLLIGAFLPGDSLLFTAGFLTYTGFLSIDINLLVLILFIAAVLGDSTGYTFGRRVGRKLFSRPDSKLFKQAYVEKAEVFYEKHGGKTIIMARFVPFVRTFAPVIAGTAKMNYRTFLTYNIIGALLWAVGITYLGYFLGSWFESMGLDIDQVILPAAAIIILISIAPPLYHLLKEKEQREAIWNGTKLQLRKLFKK
ncbi:VTT domain-containing protein [Streptomyces caniscabiei]|uniref:VTT domain-containing protein n=1 Tax=Streptomyces caniscabiei TaxID=2746961 RepID=UPI0029A77800|nr:VTT domain-containing protein [Streptomyces caniscabiei]MDX2776708.1 VTT domain-containing protein [Streptomyces caniscabiei]